MAEALAVQAKLASAGDCVKIWDSCTFRMCHQFSSSIATSFHKVDWSSDQQQLVSVPTSGSSLLLTLVKHQTSVQHVEFDTKVPNTVAKFSSTSSRFLGIGSKSGDILIWDVKHSKPKKSFKCSHGEITCLEFNWNDSYIATGFIDGSIILHNTTTSQSSQPLYTADSQAIRDLSYSYVKKGLIGCASDDGTIALWDSCTRQVQHRFSNAHLAPAVGLSFSPVNAFLLASVGLDKKVVFYDVANKKLVKSLNCESPLTSIAIKEDGVTVATGSSRGLIYIYDLRSCDVPVATISAHCTSVQSLSFQNAPIQTMSKKDQRKAGYKLESDISEALSAQKSAFEGSSVKPKTEMSMPLHVQHALYSHLKERGSYTTEIFSPLREFPQKGAEMLPKNFDSSPGNSPVFFTAADEPVQENYRGSLTDEIFSPVRDLGIPAKTHLKPSPLIGIPPSLPSAFAGQDLLIPDECFTESQKTSLGEMFSPLASDNKIVFCNIEREQPLEAGENILSSPVLTVRPTLSYPVQDQLSFSSVSTESSNLVNLPFQNNLFKSTDEINSSTTARSEGDHTLQNNEINDSEASKFFEIRPEISEAMEFDIPSSAVENKSVASEKSPDQGKKEPVDDEGKGNSEPPTPMAPQAFQAEFVREIIDDAMEEFRQEIRHSFLHYYIQMVRQFERQKAEMEALLQRYSINDELVSEIKRLREENNHLRATF